VTRAAGIPLFFCLLFIAIGVPWIEKPGIQTDEVIRRRHLPAVPENLSYSHVQT
jgi:hypothetical protein